MTSLVSTLPSLFWSCGTSGPQDRTSTWDYAASSRVDPIERSNRTLAGADQFQLGLARTRKRVCLWANAQMLVQLTVTRLLISSHCRSGVSGVESKVSCRDSWWDQ